jgi:8-oxo-dGTP pyrophosphatase MutT (NUDIX family)
MTDELTFTNTPNRPVEIDGKIYWISRSVAVLPVLYFVVADDIFVPLGKRGLELPDEQGKWCLPSGYLDYDETAGQGAIREVYEEVGLNLPHLMENYPFKGDLDQPYYVSSQPVRLQNVTLRFPLMFFVEELPPLAPKVSVGEVEEARWFSLQEAIATPLAFDHNLVLRHCLTHYYQWGDRLPD